MDEDRVVGAMLGLACGDALGAPAEFLSRAELQARHGHLTEMIGGGGWLPGEWTDDTAMALCVAEGILAAPDDPVSEIGKSFLAWRASGPKDVGNTIANALDRFHGDWPAASQGTHAAKQRMAAGNGSLMRTLPVALAYSDQSVMLRQAARISAMTHWDPQAEVCCAIYCLWVRRLLAGEPRQMSWQAALADAKEMAARQEVPVPPDTPGMSPLPHGFWSRLENVADLSEDRLQPSGYAGYVLDCLEASVWWVLQADSLESALIGCVNLAGESDTIAAVAGGAAGALWGASAIPARWREQLIEHERIAALGRSFA
jgi:ADP-ribosyl-[dinitrogen reductase] hydrolase